MLGIWGMESNFGKMKGSMSVMRSLATLAYEGRRRELFAHEFVDLLRIADTGIPR